MTSISIIFPEFEYFWAMISITRKGLDGWDNALVEGLKKEFEEKRCILLPQLLEESLLQKIIGDIEQSSFYENEHVSIEKKVFATDLSLPGKNLALHQVHFLLNNPRLFQLIGYITGCPPIKGFAGRIYRNMPGSDHHLDWHDDTQDKTRLVGLSMNLGREKYTGGLFQIRKRDAEELLREVACGHPGDTHIFAVSPHLQHRVTKTTGEHPRTAAAGWFVSEPPVPLFKK